MNTLCPDVKLSNLRVTAITLEPSAGCLLSACITEMLAVAAMYDVEVTVLHNSKAYHVNPQALQDAVEVPSDA